MWTGYLFYGLRIIKITSQGNGNRELHNRNMSTRYSAGPYPPYIVPLIPAHLDVMSVTIRSDMVSIVVLNCNNVAYTIRQNGISEKIHDNYW